MDVTVNPAFVLFSALLPVLIALVKQQGFSTQVNACIALGIYIVVGVAGVLTSGATLTIGNAVELISIATVVGSAAYNLFWNNLGVSGDGTVSFDKYLTSITSFVKAA